MSSSAFYGASRVKRIAPSLDFWELYKLFSETRILDGNTVANWKDSIMKMTKKNADI